MNNNPPDIDWEQPMVCMYGCGFEGTFAEVIEHQIEEHVGKKEE